MDELDKIREAMVAAVRKFGSRPTLVRVTEDPATFGMTPEQLADFETSVRAAALWVRTTTLLGQNDPEIELLAIAAALGAIASWDHDNGLQLALLLAYRLITAAEQVKEQP